MLPNDNFQVLKTGTNKKQVLHRMRMRPFTSHQPPPDIQFGPQEWKPDPEVRSKHDDLYAIECECENEKLVFDRKNSNATPPSSLKTPVQSEISTEETWNTLRIAQECSREIVPQTDNLSDVTNTYSDMEPDAERSLEQPNNSPTNPRSSKYNLRHNLRPICIDDYNYYFFSCTSVFHGTRTWLFQKFQERVT